MNWFFFFLIVVVVFFTDVCILWVVMYSSCLVDEKIAENDRGGRLWKVGLFCRQHRSLIWLNICTVVV